MRVAVLGAGGAFGQSLCNYLTSLERFGYEVVGIGRSDVKPEPYSLGSNFRYAKIDCLENFEDLAIFLEGFNADVVVNFAAQAGLVPQSWQYPVEFHRTNASLPVYIANRLPRHCRYIHIGSSEVYGSTHDPADEDAPIRPSSPYAASKAAADMHLMTLKDDRITVVRPSNCYVEGQALYRLIPRTVYACLTGDKIKVAGNPEKSYMHADDLNAALEILIRDKVPGLFNVGPVSATPIWEIVSLVAQVYGRPLKEVAEVTEGRAHEDHRFCVNSSKMRALGWKPNISLRTGITRMVEWGKKYRDEIVTMPTDYTFRP